MQMKSNALFSPTSTPKGLDLAYHIKLCYRGQEKQNEKLQLFRTGKTIYPRQKPILCCQCTQQLFSNFKIANWGIPLLLQMGPLTLILSHNCNLGDEISGIPESVR